jgi:hypothetical protein
MAGSVTGRYPLPTQLRQLDEPKQFSYRGRVKWKEQDCVVLTVQEQESPTGVRELWVGTQKPHPIYFSRARDGDKVYWQMEVDYRPEPDLLLLPRSWTVTWYFFGDPKLFYMQTFHIKNILINPPLPAERFEKALEPGMVVHDVAKNASLEVREDGSLGPLQHPHPERKGLRRIWTWLAILVSTLLVVGLALRYLKKSQQQRVA